MNDIRAIRLCAHMQCHVIWQFYNFICALTLRLWLISRLTSTYEKHLDVYTFLANGSWLSGQQLTNLFGFFILNFHIFWMEFTFSLTYTGNNCTTRGKKNLFIKLYIRWSLEYCYFIARVPINNFTLALFTWNIWSVLHDQPVPQNATAEYRNNFFLLQINNALKHHTESNTECQHFLLISTVSSFWNCKKKIVKIWVFLVKINLHFVTKFLNN